MKIISLDNIKDRCFQIGQIYAVIGPIIIIVGIYMKRRNLYDMHHAIPGKLFLQWRPIAPVVLLQLCWYVLTCGCPWLSEQAFCSPCSSPAS